MFPKISPLQRQYLTKYFTVLFSDTFEDGTFNVWDTLLTSPGATITAETTDPHHGIYHGKASCPGSQVAEYAQIREHFGSTYPELYMRGYFKFKTALPANGEQYEPLASACQNNWATHVCANNYLGTMRWKLTYYKNGAYVDLYNLVDAGPALDIWYCIELYNKIDAVNGAVALYVDGVQLISDSGFDSTGWLNLWVIAVGERLSTGQTTHDIYFDDIVVADQYTGPDKRPIYIVFAQPGGTEPRKIYGVFK